MDRGKGRKTEDHIRDKKGVTGWSNNKEKTTNNTKGRKTLLYKEHENTNRKTNHVNQNIHNSTTT